MTKPAIGEPRVYPGSSVPILYPGEVASAHVNPAALLAAYARGETEVPITNWIVEPMPGWRGWWLRTRYRVWGRWFTRRAAPRLTSHVELTQERR